MSIYLLILLEQKYKSIYINFIFNIFKLSIFPIHFIDTILIPFFSLNMRQPVANLVRFIILL